MSKKSQRKRGKQGGSNWTSPKAAFARASKLMDEGELKEAIELLENTAQRNPRDVQILGLLADAYYETGQYAKEWYVYVFQLRPLQPRDPDLWLVIFGLCMINNMPFNAAYEGDQFLERWPDHIEADEVRKQRKEIQEVCDEIVADGLREPDVTTDDLVLLEQTTLVMSLGHFSQARRLSEELLKRRPSAIAPLNNLALCDAQEGNLAEAVQRTYQVLERQPDNLFALARLVQYLVRIGDREGAASTAERLRKQQPVGAEQWYLMIEGLAYLCDDAAVIELFRRYEESKLDDDDLPAAFLHLAAVSFSWQGEPKQAQKLWHRALKVDPDMEIVHENLFDMKLPEGQRSGAWPFSIRYWLLELWINELASIGEIGIRNEAAAEKRMVRLIEKTPALRAVIPRILERGDPMSRKFAAMLCRTGQMYEELQDYALSTWGPDSERLQAAQFLSEKGILSDEQPVLLSVRGERQELLLLNQEITFEPEPDESVPEEVQELIEQAHNAALDGDYEESEELARKGLELLPNHPPLMNFLAASLYGMSRRKEADEVTRKMFEIHPDYLFARTGMAQIYLREKRVQDVREMIEPYLTSKKFHISEYAAIVNVQFGLAMATGENEVAERLINMLRAIDSEHPLVYAMEQKLKKPRLLR